MLDHYRQRRIGFIIVTGICAVLVVASTVSLWQPVWPHRVEPPAALPEANLRVDVLVTPPRSYVVSQAALYCDPGVAISCPSSVSWCGPQWTRWCDEKSLNVPLRLDATGQGVLWFSVSPRPNRKSDWGGLPQPSIVVHIDGVGEPLVTPMVAAADYLRLVITLL